MFRSTLRVASPIVVGTAALLFSATVSFAQEDAAGGDLALEGPDGAEGAAAAAEPLPPPKFVILPTKGKGGPNLKRPIKKLIEKPLKKNKKYTVVPFNKYKKGAKKAKIKRKDLFSIASATEIGEQIGLTHVLIIEGAMEQRPIGRKKMKVFFAVVSLIDVKTGDVVHTKRWALKGKKLSKDIAAKLVERVEQAFEPPPPPPPPEPEPEPPAPPPPPEPPPVADVTEEPAAEGDLALTMPDASPTDTASSETDSAEGEVTDEELAAIEAAPPVDEPPVEEEPAEEPLTVARIDEPIAIDRDVPPPKPKRSDRWRPYLQAVTGFMAMSRKADLRAKNAPQTPPCFCARDEGAMEPIFPAGYLAAEFYPMAMPALGGNGAIYEGIGLHLETFWTNVTTIIDSAGTEIQSSVPYVRGGPSFRFVWWESTTAPDVRLDLGMSYFHFPLRRGAFPGVSYWGQFYVGLDFNVPLFTEYVSLMFGGHYSVLTEPGGKTKRLSGDPELVDPEIRWTTQYLIQGGLRVNWWIFEARALFRFQHFSGRWEGTTDLDLGVQFTNPKLTDEIMGGILAVGVAL